MLLMAYLLFVKLFLSMLAPFVCCDCGWLPQGLQLPHYTFHCTLLHDVAFLVVQVLSHDQTHMVSFWISESLAIFSVSAKRGFRTSANDKLICASTRFFKFCMF